MITYPQPLSFTPQRTCSWKHQPFSLCVLSQISSPLWASLTHVKFGIVSAVPKVYCSLAFSPSGVGAGDSGEFFLCQGERMTRSSHHLFLDSDASPWGLWLVPRAPHANQCFLAPLHLCHPPGRRRMMLVLERLSIFKGPNFPRATCFSRPQVIAQEPDGWPGHQTTPLVRSHFPFMAGCCGYQIDAHIWNCISLYLSHVFK